MVWVARAEAQLSQSGYTAGHYKWQQLFGTPALSLHSHQQPGSPPLFIQTPPQRTNSYLWARCLRDLGKEGPWSPPLKRPPSSESAKIKMTTRGSRKPTMGHSVKVSSWASHGQSPPCTQPSAMSSNPNANLTLPILLATLPPHITVFSLESPCHGSIQISWPLWVFQIKHTYLKIWR